MLMPCHRIAWMALCSQGAHAEGGLYLRKLVVQTLQ